MSYLYLDIENLDHTIGDFNDYIEMCNTCMHNLKVSMNNLDEWWCSEESKVYMGRFNELYHDHSSYQSFINTLISFRDYLCYVDDRLKATLEFASNEGNLLRNRFGI